MLIQSQVKKSYTILVDADLQVLKLMWYIIAMKKDKVIKILDLLKIEYPDAECALNFRNLYELIIAVALSAQTTDKSVNEATPALFKNYPTAKKLAAATPEDIEPYIRRIGMYKTKSKNIVGLANALVRDHCGEVPRDYDACEKDVLKTEEGLMKAIPQNRWSESHHSLIFHGRNCCHARKPNCEECCLKEYCEKNNV